MFEEDKITYFEKNFRENLHILDFNTIRAGGIVYNGQAGSENTHKLMEMLIHEKNPLVLSYTNKAAQNVKEGLTKRIREDEQIGFTEDKTNNIYKTFDSSFGK